MPDTCVVLPIRAAMTAMGISRVMTRISASNSDTNALRERAEVAFIVLVLHPLGRLPRGARACQ